MMHTRLGIFAAAAVLTAAASQAPPPAPPPFAPVAARGDLVFASGILPAAPAQADCRGPGRTGARRIEGPAGARRHVPRPRRLDVGVPGRRRGLRRR